MLVAKKENYTFQENIDTTKKKRKKANKHRKTNNVSSKLKIFFYAAITMVVCLGVLLRFSYISQMQYDLLTMKNEIEALKEDKLLLTVELEKNKNLEKIETEAIQKLGMQYPKDNQIVYINVKMDSQNNIDLANNNINNSGFFLDAFDNTIGQILDSISSIRR